jgi:Glycosyltransferase family 87
MTVILENAARGQGRTKSLTPIMALVLLVGTFTGAAVHFAEGIYLGRPYPWNTFLFRPNDRFMDFFNDYHRAVVYGVDGNNILDYSPFAHLTMKISTILPPSPAFFVVLGVFCVCFAVCIWVFFCRREDGALLNAWYVVVLSSFSYAFIFAVDRTNMEMFMFILLFGYVWAYSLRRYGLAAALLGAAIALKMYPVVFLILPLTDRRVRDTLWGACWAAGFTAVGVVALAALTSVGPLTVVKDWIDTLVGGHGTYLSMGFEPLTHRHSLYGVVQATWLLVAGVNPSAGVRGAYLVVAALAFVAISGWLIFRSRPSAGMPIPLWCRVGVLTLCMLLLPFLSADYALLCLYLPLMLLAAHGWRRPIDLAAALALTLVLVPIDYYVLSADTTISVFVYPALMTVALVLMLWGSRAGTAADDRTANGGTALSDPVPDAQ